MSRLAVVAAFLSALSATAAVAQQAQAPAPVPAPAREQQPGPEQQVEPEQSGEVNAADWIRGALANQRYDPQDRARARNYAPELEGSTHWRSSIFDGRRSRATTGTGLRLPNLPTSGGEQAEDERHEASEAIATNVAREFDDKVSPEVSDSGELTL